MKLKTKFQYDDSLDVFGVHGVGGFVGTVMLGFLAHKSFGGLNDAASFTTQLQAAIYTAGWSAAVSVALLFMIRRTIGLRVTELAEREGLDAAEHGEAAYNNQ